MAQISDFKAQMFGGGARPNQFRVGLNFPNAVSAGTLVGLNAQFLCKAAQLPASNVENVQTFYRGRPVNFAGERSFEPWTVTIYNDTTFSIRNAMEAWSNSISNFTGTNGLTRARDYQTDMQVFQLDRNGDAPIKQYNFVNAYPMSISAIELDFESNNVIEQFQVTFMYDYFTTGEINSSSGFGVGVAVNTPIGTLPI